MKYARFFCWPLTVFLVVPKLAAEGPGMDCTRQLADGKVNCWAVNPGDFDIVWHTMAYDRVEDSKTGEKVRLPINSKYYTLIILNFFKGDKVELQAVRYARAQPNGEVEYLSYPQGHDPNQGIAKPIQQQKACIVTFARGEDKIYYETVIIVDETDTEYLVRKTGYDKPVNVPKDNVLLLNERRTVTAPDGRKRGCTCAEH